MFEIYGGKTAFKQWDKNQKLIMGSLPVGAEVHFYNDPFEDDPLMTEIYEMQDENGKMIRVCNVPNIFLKTDSKIKACVPERVRGRYGNLYSVVGSRERIYEVETAERPADYVYEETELSSCCPGSGVDLTALIAQVERNTSGISTLAGGLDGLGHELDVFTERVEAALDSKQDKLTSAEGEVF